MSLLTGDRPRRRVARSTNQSTNKVGNQHYFVPVHPFSSTDGPYNKPGYFLTPGKDLRIPQRMPMKQWLNIGSITHWIVLSLGVLAVITLMMAVSMIQTPWQQKTPNQLINHYNQLRRSSGDDDLLEIHMRLREIIELKPIVDTFPAPIIQELADQSINHSPIEFVWQRSDDLIHQSILNQTDLHAILHGIDDHDDQSVYQSSKQSWIMLFHGCSHGAMDWWTLPEERMIVRYFLSLGISVFAVSSANRESGCWDTSFAPSTSQSVNQSINHQSINVDAVRVLTAFQQFAEREFDTQPKHDLFVYGGSSGGSFASIISRALPIRAQVIQISPGVESAFMTASTRATKSINQPIHQSINPYALYSSDTLYPVPPTVFVYMSRDVHWASEIRIKSIAQKLKDSGRRVGPRLMKADSVVMHRVAPRAITKEFLYERIDDISLTESDAFFRALHRDAFIDRYGFLIEDPRHSHMIGYLIDLHSDKSINRDQSTPNVELSVLLSRHRAEIEEETNVAWAEHELTEAHTDQIAWWMLAQAK